MKHEIDLLLLKVADGARILRFSEPQSGLCLEKRLEPGESVARQKERWRQVFVSMLERELGAASRGFQPFNLFLKTNGLHYPPHRGHREVAELLKTRGGKTAEALQQPDRADLN